LKSCQNFFYIAYGLVLSSTVRHIQIRNDFFYLIHMRCRFCDRNGRQGGAEVKMKSVFTPCLTAIRTGMPFRIPEQKSDLKPGFAISVY